MGRYPWSPRSHRPGWSLTYGSLRRSSGRRHGPGESWDHRARSGLDPPVASAGCAASLSLLFELALRVGV